MKKYTYTFDQLRDNPSGARALFMSYKWTMKHGGVDLDNYFTADSGKIEANSPMEACEKLFRIYNLRNVMSYEGRSMSVSDIVNIWDNDQDPPEKSSWYCDSFGFVRL